MVVMEPVMDTTILAIYGYHTLYGCSPDKHPQKYEHPLGFLPKRSSP